MKKTKTEKTMVRNPEARGFTIGENLWTASHVTMARPLWNSADDLVGACVEFLYTTQNPSLALSPPSEEFVVMWDGIRFTYSPTKKDHEKYLKNRGRKLDKVYFKRIM